MQTVVKIVPFLLLVLLVEFDLIQSISQDKQCIKASDCKCTRSYDGASIDLSTYAHYPINIQHGGDSYRFSPCTTIVCGGIDDASICQLHSYSYFEYGKLNTASFTTADDGKVSLSYEGDSDSFCSPRKSVVNLECDKTVEAKLTVIKEEPKCTMHFNLVTKYACLPDLPSSPSSGLSIGDILLIIFFIGLFLYFVFGAIYLKFVRHEETISELIIHKKFWIGLPFLAKDGFTFMLYKTIWRNQAPPTYEPI